MSLLYSSSKRSDLSMVKICQATWCSISILNQNRDNVDVEFREQ